MQVFSPALQCAAGMMTVTLRALTEAVQNRAAAEGQRQAGGRRRGGGGGGEGEEGGGKEGDAPKEVNIEALDEELQASVEGSGNEWQSFICSSSSHSHSHLPPPPTHSHPHPLPPSPPPPHTHPAPYFHSISPTPLSQAARHALLELCKSLDLFRACQKVLCTVRVYSMYVSEKLTQTNSLLRVLIDENLLLIAINVRAFK